MKKRALFLTAIALILAIAGCKKGNPVAKIESISFKESTYEVYDNEQDLYLKKELNVTPAGIMDTCKITYSSSDEEIAYVDAGYLIPQSEGEVKITATIQGMSAACTVVVTPVPVKSITIEDMEVSLNGSAKLKYETVPRGVPVSRIRFSSSDDDIAYVNSDGTVQGKGVGTATITAKVDGKEDDCTVKVSIKKVDKVIVTPATHKFSKKGETVTLKATIEPADASYPEIKWSTNDPSVAVVDETTGVVTSTGGGKAIIKATAVKDDVSGQCEVETPKVGVKSVTVNTDKIRTESQSFTQTLTVEILPPDAADLPVKWTSKGIAKVDANGKVSVTGGGYGVVYAEVEGVKDSCEVYVKDLKHYMRDCQAHLYYTTVINGQEWMAENLRCNIYDTYSPKKGVQIETSSSSVCTPYYFDGKNYEKGTTCFTTYDRNRFGYSYNWAAAVGVDKGDDANT
ncbi:MAG: Ig-like domain-containing protein, partial [Paludibacteraceae bacterium]|nr:Ig-like domain-containing protein [Paludibacteraceae bacterium]